MLENADTEARLAGASMVETAHVLVALFSSDTPAGKLLRQCVDERSLRAVLRDRGVKVSA